MTATTSPTRHTLSRKPKAHPTTDQASIFTPTPAAAPVQATTAAQVQASAVPADTDDQEAQLRATWEAWRADGNPAHDAEHSRRYADEAVKIGLSFYDRDGTDLAAKGWQLWADWASRSKGA